MSEQLNREIVEKMWHALSEMDWEGMKACMHPQIHYRDVPSDDPGAHGEIYGAAPGDDAGTGDASSGHRR